MKKVLPIVLGILMVFGAFGHIAVPEQYAPMIPSFISETLAHLFATVAEGAIGIALLIPKYRKWGGLGFFALMIIFLPIHIWDVLRESPAAGSALAAWIRLGVQFLFIYAGWWIKGKYE